MNKPSAAPFEVLGATELMDELLLIILFFFFFIQVYINGKNGYLWDDQNSQVFGCLWKQAS